MVVDYLKVERKVKSSILLNKKIDQWVVATYCDYGNAEKKIIKRHYSFESANREFVKIIKSYTNKGTWRCWQENKKGKIINDSLIYKPAQKNKEDNWKVATYCDYGIENNKKIVCKHLSLETAKKNFNKLKARFSNKGTWRCWQQDKKGKIINDTKLKI